MLLTFLAILTLASAEQVKLSEDTSACAEDKKTLCPNVGSNEFSILICLQREIGGSKAKVSKECHQEMWEFKKDAATSERFITKINKMCQEEISSHCGGKPVVECMLEERMSLSDQTQCKRYLNTMAQIFFADYHLVTNFIEKCGADVAKLSCGNIKTDISEELSSQANVMSCLERKVKKLSAECKQVLIKKEEEAADSFQLDRALYLACLDDRTRLCRDVPDDAGAVYNCLGEYKFDPHMSTNCRNEVVRRQLLTLEDYKIDYGLMKSCGADLVTQHCLDKRIADRLSEGFMRTTVLLQCLSNADNDKTRVAVSKNCLTKVHSVKKMIMGDLELTPSLAMNCHDDVEKQCSSVSNKVEGGVIDCLMNLAETEGALDKNCHEELLEFVEVVDPINDYQLNYALMQNCGDYISEHCKIEQGEGQAMICLMNLELSQELREQCHLQILSYKYFMSRSILLDKPLLKACKEDAVRLCKSDFGEETEGSKPRGAVISCLYHHIYMEAEMKLSSKCMPELKRAIVAQGESVNLAPQIVSACVDDLVNYCPGEAKEKDDYGCLQKHLSDPDSSLSEQCGREMITYARLVSEDVRYDYRLMKACSRVISEKCASARDSNTHSDLLMCLIESRDKIVGKCKGHVKDLQLVALIDFNFNAKFVDACHSDVQRFCKYTKDGRAVTKKQEVMYCLRDKILDTRGKPQVEQLEGKCKAQLKKEFIQQMSDIDLDPALVTACSRELRGICKDTVHDKGEVMECLRSNEDKLEKQCQEKVFQRELQQAEEPIVDVQLQERCGRAIDLYCHDRPADEIMSCLEQVIHQSGVDQACRFVIRNRMKGEHANVQLNIALSTACSSDIKKHCPLVQGGEGKVILCLKEHYHELSVDCEERMTELRQQEVEDYSLDPVLSKHCAKDIPKLCSGRPNHEVEECLRFNILEISSQQCAKQVVRLITEAHADIHLDPVLLRTCQKDIGYLCGRIQSGYGQIIDCLQSNYNRDQNSLTPTCSHMLNSRIKMWKNAIDTAKEYGSAVETMDELYRAVAASQHKHEILAYLIAACFCLVLLSFCGGRCTKRKLPSKLI